MCWSVLIEMDDYIREGESMNHNEFIKFNGCLWLWVHTSAVVTAIFMRYISVICVMVLWSS